MLRCEFMRDCGKFGLHYGNAPVSTTLARLNVVDIKTIVFTLHHHR